ncbi:MAG: hypothetical protein ABSH20_20505 [Tepidisphaeraceae bacterium]|jgi:hypothetical protein
MRRWTKAASAVLAVAAIDATLFYAASDTVESLTQKLWPRQRIEEVSKAIDQQRKDGLLSDVAYAMRQQALEDRRAGNTPVGARVF